MRTRQLVVVSTDCSNGRHHVAFGCKGGQPEEWHCARLESDVVGTQFADGSTVRADAFGDGGAIGADGKMRLKELAHGDLNVVTFKLLLRILAQFRGACNEWYAASSGGAEHAVHHACFASGKVVVGTARTDHILEVSGVDITLKVDASNGLSGGFSGSALQCAKCSLLQKHHATISAHL